MEQCSPFGWFYYNEEEGMVGEMRQYILQSRMELEATVIAAQEEIMKKEEELIHMKDLLIITIKERDEAQSNFQKLMLEKLQLQQQLQQQQQRLRQPQQQQETQQQRQQKVAAAVSLSNTNTTINCFSSSSSECEESSIISSPQGGANSPTLQQPTQLPALPPQIAAKLASNCRPLPEKGKLLKAVMEAGPLLQTLLLAGPLPQWQHPPPRLDTIEIPPVTITTSNSPRKRGLDSFDCSMIPSPKYQRVV